MKNSITKRRLAQLEAEAEIIRQSVQASVVELPPFRDELLPRAIDAAATKTPLRPSVGRSEAIAEIWQDRLDRLTTFRRQLRRNPRWQEREFRFLLREEALCRGLFPPVDARRDVFVRVSAYLSDEEMRVALLSDLDTVTQKETVTLFKKAMKNGGRLVGFPLLVVGSGIHGTNAALGLQAFADRAVLQIDVAARRGGLFRSFTPESGPDHPAFAANSRDNRRQVASLRSRAGGRQHLNPFSIEAPTQTVAFGRNSYPGNHMLAAAAAVNSYLAGPALMGARVVGIWPNYRKQSEDEALLATVRVGETTITIPAFGGAVATGLGTFAIPNPQNDAGMTRIVTASRARLAQYLAGVTSRLPRVVTGQDFLQMAITRKANLFRSLINKVVVVVGKKDTARMVLEMLLGDAPDGRVYGDYVTQEGGPDALFWVGPSSPDRDSLKKDERLRPRYARLLVDYPRTSLDVNAAITPIAGQVTGFEETSVFPQGTLDIVIRRPDGVSDSIQGVDLCIFCTGQINTATTELLFPLTNYAPLRVVVDEEGTPMFREVSAYAGRVMLVGPAASLSISQAEREFAPDLEKIGENSASIWLNAYKVTIASRVLASAYNRTRFTEEVEAIPF